MYKNKIRTLTDFLRTALEPVGATMYIWGGGWNDEDTGAGIDSKRLGISPKWKQFFDAQNSDYDYNNHRYKHGNGLDCSGYLGWVLYNLFEGDYKSEINFVRKASEQGKMLEDMGLGKYENIIDRKTFCHKPGDIMTSKDHVYIVIQECCDGSVILVHSSPPGVQVCGTSTKNGCKCSIAVCVARQYMMTCHKEWFTKFSTCCKDTSYLTDYSRFRWYQSVLPDIDGLYKKSPQDILKVINNRRNKYC